MCNKMGIFKDIQNLLKVWRIHGVKTRRYQQDTVKKDFIHPIVIRASVRGRSQIMALLFSRF